MTSNCNTIVRYIGQSLDELTHGCLYEAMPTLNGCLTVRNNFGVWEVHINADFEYVGKIEIGSTVVIRNDLEVDKWYGGMTFNKKLEDYKNTRVKIVGKCNGHYEIEGSSYIKPRFITKEMINWDKGVFNEKY